MGRSDRKHLIAQIEEKRGSTVFCLLTSDRPNINVLLQKDVLPRFVNQLRKKKNREAIDLFLFTRGGDTLAGFGLARLLREYAKRVNLLVPDCCHSAGTLVALGCNEILMTRAATLSPIDPSIIRPLNPAIQLNQGLPPQLIPLSVESVAGFKALVSTEWHVSNQKNLTEILKSLSEKVHPLALGDVYRTRQQIELLAGELLRQHRTDHKSIRRIIQTLSKKLGSHDYLIYRTEAKKILGSQVTMDDVLEEMIWDLYMDFVEEMALGVPFDPNLALGPLPTQPPGQLALQSPQRTAIVELKLALIESEGSGDRAIRRVSISDALLPQPNGQFIRQVLPPADIFAGWESYA